MCTQQLHNLCPVHCNCVLLYCKDKASRATMVCETQSEQNIRQKMTINSSMQEVVAIDNQLRVLLRYMSCTNLLKCSFHLKYLYFSFQCDIYTVRIYFLLSLFILNHTKESLHYDVIYF